MIMRNTTNGALQVIDINNNQLTGTHFMGAVGLDWQPSGFGNFSGIPGETDMIMRNTTTGGLEVYDIANNQITGAAFLGTVGLNWQFAGVAPIHAPGASDLVLRNVNTGAFEVYDIANNQITGSEPLGMVGLDWQLPQSPLGLPGGGFAPSSPTGAMGSSDSNASSCRRWPALATAAARVRASRCRHVTADVPDDAAACMSQRQRKCPRRERGSRFGSRQNNDDSSVSGRCGSSRTHKGRPGA